MERNYGEEIDSLKSEIAEMKKMLASSLSGKSPAQTQQSGHPNDLQRSIPTDNDSYRTPVPTDDGLSGIHVPTIDDVMQHMHADNNLSQKYVSLCTKAKNSGATGMITYLGVFASGGRQSNWISDGRHTDDLLELVENHTAEKVLRCLGNSDRLNILLAILRRPMSVAELVQTCGMNTTGQVYHHMKPLLTADLIAEDEHNKGVYVVQPHKVQGIIMLLAGICDMVDETYTKGSWNEE